MIAPSRQLGARLLEWTVVSVVGLTGGWLMRGEPAPTAAPVHSECSHDIARTAAAQAVSTRPVSVAVRTAPTEPESDDEEALRREAEDYQRKTRELLGTLEMRVAVSEQHEQKGSPESIVNESAEYIRGMTDMMTTAAPELISAFAEHIEAPFCGSQATQSKAAQMMYMRMMRSAPELSSQKTFDCFFSKHKAEDVVLWEGIDALRGADLPFPKGLSEVAARATAPQTKIRLLTEEQFKEYKQKQTEQARELLSASQSGANHQVVTP